MNKANLKSYAPQARKDFIAAVAARANQLGLSFKAGSLEVSPAQTQGDVTVIAGQAWPSKVSGQREKLIERIRKDGFEHTMEAVAYTWFNRFAALRYMELHDFLGHGHRALSSTAGGLPDILTHATDLSNDLPGLNAAKVTEIKLAGNRDGELYRMLLVAQCNALSRAMPFLFERIDDDSELLLPDNLLRSDSVIAKLVEAIPEEDWAEVEIIGWLYQFYISEKKDQVIGKVVKSEDIPAATQLFTPNWIVQYLVQNSVGRLWLMANPQSTLAKEWPYYITPAEQAPEVQAQLDALIQTRVREDGDTLNPESITVLDPACGSGHILVVAYDVLKAIYLERGYQPRAIPRLILEKNLYGLDIDDRAAQMAGFALLMKARADDRRLFTTTDDAGNLQPPKLNVLSLQESKGLSADELATHLTPFKVQRSTISSLLETFEHAKTFGSLIQIPHMLKSQLAVLPEVLALVKQSGELYATAAADDLLPLVRQGRVLAMQFDAVVANPPYMGGKGMNQALKDYARTTFPDSKSDLFSMFMERGFEWCKPSGANSMVTMQSWMFLSSYEAMRERFLQERAIQTMAHLGARAFSEISGEVVQTTAFVLNAQKYHGFKPTFIRLVDGQELDKESALRNGSNRFNAISQDDFAKIPGSPIAYWVSHNTIRAFGLIKISAVAETRLGMATADNNKFLRLWYEVNSNKLGLKVSSRSEALNSTKKWFQYQKGGEFRKWYGNLEYVVNWEADGKEIQSFSDPETGRIRSHNYNLDFIFKEGVTWNALSSSNISARISRYSLFDNAGSSLFANSSEDNFALLSLMNSFVVGDLIKIISPTLNYQPGDIAKLPVAYSKLQRDLIAKNAKTAIEISKIDWDMFETSSGFSQCPLAIRKPHETLISESWSNHSKYLSQRTNELRAIESENNQILIDAYGLQSELSSEVPESQITLALAEREKDCQRFISYILGCMLGRYSLDEPGLIYAHAGNVGFEPGRYTTFPADADGIIPITDELWFSDDAPSRIREFLRAVWGPETLEENMAWLAESLGSKASETPDETIRRYIADKFFKDHLQTYKKRPIYWLFSSGKQGAFQALVYLHRYHDGTLARLRAEYVVPLTGKIQSRIEMLQKDALAASSTAARNKLAKEVEKLKKKHVELLAYDEQLRHYADMRITLDLDDGVKVNYGKFGDLLAEVKAITGGASDD
jgi:type II restriction/modification system DNA methylase subunit YeeA